MMLTGLLAIVTLLLKLAPDAPLARIVHRMGVAWPLEQLGKLSLQQAIFGALLVGFALGGPEIFFLFGPELATAYLVDLSIYFDAVLVTYAIASAGAIKAGLGRMRLAAARLLRRPQAARRKRTPVARPHKPQANDDEPHPAMLRLAA